MPIAQNSSIIDLVPILSTLGDILSSPLGSFTYHVLLLLAVEAALALAWADWRRARRGDAGHLPLALVGLILVRVPYILAALAAALAWSTPEALLPPLERFADTASICLLGWAFVVPERRRGRGWRFLLGANLILAVGVCVGFTLSWGQTLAAHSQIPYFRHWQSTVWSLWQLGLIPLTSLAIVVRRKEGWGTLLLTMLLLFLGRLLQLLFQLAVPNQPIWERLSNLVAYPLIPVAVYQNLYADLRLHVRHMQEVSQASIEQIKSLLAVIEVSQQVSGSLSLSTVLDRGARGAAYAVNADQCAIVLPEDEDPSRVRLAAIYNSERRGRVAASSIPLQYQVTIQRAMRTRRHVIVEESDSAQLKVLFSLFGSSETGPILVQPILIDGEALGAIVVGNSNSRRPFTAHEAKICQHLAGHLATAIQNARRYQSAQMEGGEMHESRGVQDGSRRARALVASVQDQYREEVGDLEVLNPPRLPQEVEPANDPVQESSADGRPIVTGDGWVDMDVRV